MRSWAMKLSCDIMACPMGEIVAIARFFDHASANLVHFIPFYHLLFGKLGLDKFGSGLLRFSDDIENLLLPYCWLIRGDCYPCNVSINGLRLFFFAPQVDEDKIAVKDLPSL